MNSCKCSCHNAIYTIDQSIEYMNALAGFKYTGNALLSDKKESYSYVLLYNPVESNMNLVLCDRVHANLSEAIGITSVYFQCQCTIPTDATLLSSVYNDNSRNCQLNREGQMYSGYLLDVPNNPAIIYTLAPYTTGVERVGGSHIISPGCGYLMVTATQQDNLGQQSTSLSWWEEPICYC